MVSDYLVDEVIACMFSFLFPQKGTMTRDGENGFLGLRIGGQYLRVFSTCLYLWVIFLTKNLFKYDVNNSGSPPKFQETYHEKSI